MSWEWDSPDSLYIWSVTLQADGTSNDSDEVRTKQSLDSSGSSQPSAAQGSASSSGNTTGSSTAATGKGSPKPISAANKKELLKGATMRTSVRLFLHAHAPVSCRDSCLKMWRLQGLVWFATILQFMNCKFVLSVEFQHTLCITFRWACTVHNSPPNLDTQLQSNQSSSYSLYWGSSGRGIRPLILNVQSLLFSFLLQGSALSVMPPLPSCWNEK